jgi:O-antigen ligase
LRWLIIPLLLAILLSGSRTSILAAILFLLFVRFYRYSPFIGFIAFVGIAFAAEIVSSNLVELVRAFKLEEYFRLETLEEGSGRFIAWNFAWQEIQNQFWFGRGFAYDEWYMDRHQDFLNILGHQGGVHNTYLIIWLNTGIIGLLLFLRAWVLLFIAGSRNTAVAIPALYLVLFSVSLEPWLAASLNPFTILLITSIVIMTDEVFQPYIRGELSAFEKPKEIPVLA